MCDAQLSAKDIIELRREGASRVSSWQTVIIDGIGPKSGTGYAGGGMAETSKKGIAFQG